MSHSSKQTEIYAMQCQFLQLKSKRNSVTGLREHYIEELVPYRQEYHTCSFYYGRGAASESVDQNKSPHAVDFALCCSGDAPGEANCQSEVEPSSALVEVGSSTLARGGPYAESRSSAPKPNPPPEGVPPLLQYVGLFVSLASGLQNGLDLPFMWGLLFAVLAMLMFRKMNP